MVRDKRVILLGGEPREPARVRLENAFAMSELEWIPGDNPRRLDSVVERVHQHKVDLVLVLQQWNAHKVTNKLIDACKSSGLPWALEISPAARLNAGLPAADLKYATFQPSFLYELVFDLALAAALVWLGRRRPVKPAGLFALYVAGYSGYRIFEETIRIDSSAYFLGLRLNFFIAIAVTVAGLAWFAFTQRRGAARRPSAVRVPAADQQASERVRVSPGRPHAGGTGAQGDISIS